MKPKVARTFPRMCLPSLSACVVGLTLSAGTAVAQSGSQTWTGAVDSDFYDGGNWSGGVTYPNGNCTFAGTVANSTITRTSDTYTYVFGLYFNNTLGTESSFTFPAGGTQFNWGGPASATSTVTSGSLVDEIGVNVALVGAGTQQLKVLTIGANHDLHISGDVTSGGATYTFTKAGAGNLILSGSNSFTAPITINGGALQLGDGGSGGTLNASNSIVVNSGASLVINQSDTVTQGVDFTSAAIAGEGGLTQAGSGTTILNVANTYTGPTQVTGGLLSLTTAALGDTSTVTVSGGVLDLDFAGTDTIAVLDLGSGPVATGVWGSVASGAANTDASLTGTGTLTVVGPQATVVWDGSTDTVWTAPDSTSWSGDTYKDNDLAEFADAGAGAVTISGTVAPASVTVNSGTGFNYTFGGDAIGGSATLTKAGDSRLFLNNASSYTGDTFINGGQIEISNGNALGSPSGGTTIGNLAQLRLSGAMTIAEPLTNSGGGGGKLSSVGGGIKTLTGLITLADSMDLRGNDYVFQGGFTSATNAGIGFNGARYIVENTPITIGTGGFGVTSAGEDPANATQINIGGNDWGGTTINFTGYLMVGGTDFLPTDTEVRFGWARWQWSTGVLDLNGNDQTVRSLGINGNSLNLGGNHRVTGLTGDVLTINLDSGSGNNLYQGRFEGGLSVVKDGDGILTLENLSSTTAPAVVSDPSPGPAVPSSNTGSFTINDGSVVSRAGYGASDAVNFSDACRVIVASGTTLELDYTGTDIIGALDLGGSGYLPDGVYDSTHPSGLITGTGSLTVVGANLNTLWDGSTDMTWTAPDSTSWSGDFYTDGQDVSFSDLGAGTVTVSGTVAPGSVTLNNSGGNDFTFAGDAIGGATGIEKLGDGGLTLTGVNTFTGNIVVSGGAFVIDGAGQLGSGNFAGDLTIGGTGSFEYSSTANQVISGVVGGGAAAGVTKSDTGLLDILMTATYNGPTTINGGTLRFTNDADLSSIPSSEFFINDGAALEFQSSVGGPNRTSLNNKVFTFGNSGGGTLNFNGGNHLFQGGSTHEVITTGGAQNTISSTNGGFMNMQTAGNIMFDVADGPDAVDLNLSATFNNGLITKDGAGTLAITGSHGGSYPIVVNDGSLEVGAASTLAGGLFTQTITNDGVFRFNSSGAQTISGVISGSGSVEKDNSGTLTLSAANSYSGDTTVSAGTLSLGDGTNNSNLADGSDLSVGIGAVVNLNYLGTDTIDELILGGSAKAAGTWGASGSGATNIDDAYFTGAGTVTVTTGGAASAYDTWASDNGLTGGDALDTADVESDGLVNLLEFGFGTDPNVADNSPLVADGSANGTPIIQQSGGGEGVTFDALFVRRDDYDTSGSATYTAQFSSDLLTFYDSTATPTFVADSTADPDYEVVSVPYPATLPDGKKARFFRLKVDLVP